MKRCKRALCLLLAVALTLSLGSIAVQAQETPTFEIGYYEKSCGDSVAVPIEVKNNPGIAAVKLKVAYDDTRLELTSVTYGDWGGNFQQPQKKTSPVSLTWYNGTENYTEENSTFATLTFKVLETAEAGLAAITMTYDPNNVYNIAEDNVTFAVLNGRVKVQANETCDHTPVETRYSENEDGTHNVMTFCACNRQLSWKIEECIDTDADGVCDKCGWEYTPTFSMGTCEGVRGKNVGVYLYAVDNPGIAAVKLKVAYDETCLELVSVTYGDWGGNFQQPQKKTSPVSLTWYNGTENYTEPSSMFAKLEFKVLEDAKLGDTSITMTYDPNNVYNIAEENVTFAIVNGTVQVVAPPCDHTDVTTDYTDNADGTHTMTRTCSCGKVLSEDIESCTDTDFNGSCDGCGADVAVQIEIVGTNMTLGNELVVDFHIEKSKVNVSGLTAQVFHITADDVVTYEYPQTEWEEKGAYYRIPAPVAACQMTDIVNVEIIDGDGNVVGYYEDTVCDYLMRLFDVTEEETIKILAVDMLNYGASAQAYFGYKTETPANADLTEEQKELATPTVACTNVQEKDDNYYGTTLSLRECIELNFIFKGVEEKDISTMYAEASFTNSLGEAKTVTLAGDCVIALAKGRRCQIKVTEPVLADASEPVTVTLYDADGTAYATVKDSVESYVSRYAAKYGDDTGLYGNIMKLSVSALNYVLSKQ